MVIIVLAQGSAVFVDNGQRFMAEQKVVWESPHSVAGDGDFCDSDFHLRLASDPETAYKGPQDQINQHYLKALFCTIRTESRGQLGTVLRTHQ